MDNNKKNPIIRFEEFKELYEKNGGDSNLENPYAWEQRKLGEFADISTGKLDANAMVEDGEYDFYTSGMKKYRIDTPAFEGPAITIAGNGATVGYMHLADGEFNAYQRTYVLQNFQANRYFLYSEISKKLPRKIAQEARTGNIPYIVMDMLTELTISLPVLEEEQAKIGAFFKQLDNTIALHQRKLEKSKALKSAYLSEMFPAEGERKPKRRFAGFTDDWKQGTVGEYGYFYYGKSAPKWSVTKDAIIPCVRYGELYTKFGAKIDKVYSYTNISKENLKFSTGNEVLVPRVGEDPLDFANCSWLSIPNVAIGEMISVYNTEENPLFISYYFNSQLRHAFAKRVEGGNVSNLYFTYLENITISIPNKEEQDTIANFLESLDSVVEHHQHKLEKLKNIKQAYLNELFV